MPRKNRSYKAADGKHADARLFIIACEGKETEAAYFTALEKGQKRIRTIVLPADERNLSAPKHVVERATRHLDKYQLQADDELWIVIDTDRWSTKQLREVALTCKQSGWNLAISNPCFELWLYLHYSDLPDEPPTSSRQWKKLFKQVAPDNYQIHDLMPRIADAIRRAEALDTDVNDTVPDPQQSNVYRLGKALLPFLQ